MVKETYPKLKGAAGQRGSNYQVNLLALFALEGLFLEKWKLSTEHKDAGKFDDIVYLGEDGYYMMQCKHKENKRNVATLEFLSAEKGDFALGKYFESFLEIRDKFNIKLLIIISNIGPSEKESIFEEEKKKSSTFLFPSVKHVYHLNNLGMKKVAEFLMTNSTEKQFVNEFCRTLRFFHISDSEINEGITDKLADAERILKSKFDKNHFIKNINDWFLSESGIFIKKSHVKAFLYENTIHKYLTKMSSLNIYFRENYSIGKNKILNIIPGNIDFLNILKVYRSLEKIYDINSILFINPEDDVEVTNEFIESFELPRFNTLFISLFSFHQYDETFSRISTILTKYTCKKAIIISKEPIQMNVIVDEINFSDLTKTCQNTLLSKTIVFQGKDLSLKVLINDSTDKIDSIIDPKTTIDLINNKKIEIGTSIEKIKEVEYYMERKFILHTENVLMKLSEADVCLYLVREYEPIDISEVQRQVLGLGENAGKFVTICDSAGMGKTTILTRLGYLIKETYPSFFLISIHLNLLTSILEKFQKANENITLEDLMRYKNEKYLENNFEQNIFSMTNKIILMVDALDEVRPNYTEIVEKFLLVTSKRKNIANIFLTLRPDFSKDLQSLLKITFTLSLQPYSVIEQIRFLKNYWKQNLIIDNASKQTKCEIYAKTLIRKLGESIGTNSWNFMGIPLHSRMIAEIFQESDEKEHDWICCRNYLDSENESLDLPDQLNITKLYDMFVEKKGEIFIQDKCNIQGNVPAKEIVSKIYKDAMNEHKKVAARLVFHECPLLNIFESENGISKESIMKIGIIQEIGGELVFVHRTFAEYFVAKVLWEQLNEETVSEQFIAFFMEKVLFFRQFEVIRAFFDSILINEFKQIKGIILDVCSSVFHLFKDKRRLINLLAMEGRLNILKLILDNVNLTGKVILPDLYSKIGTENRSEIIKLLVDKEADMKRKDVFGYTILDLAVEKGDVELLEYCLKRGANITQVDSDGCTIVHNAAKTRCLNTSNVEIVEISSRFRADMKSTIYGKTVKLYAIKRCRLVLLECVKTRYLEDETDYPYHLETTSYYAPDRREVKLLEYCLRIIGKGITNIGREVETSMKTSVVRASNVDIVKCCVDHGADINKKDNDEKTAIHYAAERGDIELLEYCLEKGLDINQKDKRGNTVIHYAAKEGKVEFVKYCVEKGVDINGRNHIGKTLLHYVPQLSEFECFAYCLLRLRNMDEIIKAELKGVLWAEGDKLKLMEYCLEKGADINQTDKFGHTVLFYAATTGNLELKNYCVEKGAVSNRFNNNIRGMSDSIYVDMCLQFSLYPRRIEELFC